MTQALELTRASISTLRITVAYASMVGCMLVCVLVCYACAMPASIEVLLGDRLILRDHSMGETMRTNTDAPELFAWYESK